MAGIYKSITEIIGKTPLLELCNIQASHSTKAKILAKLEGFNPAGSVKDRVALSIIESAEAEGKIKKGSVIIEPTSGNTGIGIAAIAATRGYKAIIVMPDTMSRERIALIKAYGAEVVLTKGSDGMRGAIKKAEELNRDIEGGIIAGQFENPANPRAHILSTGPEIYADTNGEVDIFVAGVGTGGTISGIGKYLKEKNPSIRIVAVEPRSSAVLSGGAAGIHNLQGIGAGFIPKVLDTDVYDEVITVNEQEAYTAAGMLARQEGVLAGISSGAALWAAIELAKRDENRGKNIVVLLADTGDRYLSTPLFEE